MTFQEWWAGLGRSSDPETIWKAAQRAAVAEEREACATLSEDYTSGEPEPNPDDERHDTKVGIAAAIRARP